MRLRAYQGKVGPIDPCAGGTEAGLMRLLAYLGKVGPIDPCAGGTQLTLNHDKAQGLHE